MSGQWNQLETVRQLLLLDGGKHLSVYKLNYRSLSELYIPSLSSLFLLPFHNLKKLEKYFLATESGHEPITLVTITVTINLNPPLWLLTTQHW